MHLKSRFAYQMFENFVYFQEVVKLSTVINYQLAFTNRSYKIETKVLLNKEENFAKHILLTLESENFLERVLYVFIIYTVKYDESWFDLILEVIKDRKISKFLLTDILLVSAQHNHQKLVIHCIENGASMKNHKEVILKHFIVNKNTVLIEYFLNSKEGADYNKDKLLEIAVTENSFEVVKRLIELGADIHFEEDVAFIKSVNCNDERIMKYLISNGANINAQSDQALVNAAKNRKFNIVKWLLSIGSRINHNVVSLAVINEDLKILQLLLEHDRNVLIDYETLIYSIKYCDEEIIRCLIENGADFGPDDGVLLKEVTDYCSPTLIWSFVKYGLNIRYDDDSALISLLESEDFLTARCFVENGANVNAQNNKPLKIALESSRLDIFNYLITYGADIHFDDEYILKKAVKENKLDFVKYLVKNQAIVTKEVVMIAVENENVKIIKSLFKGNYDLSTFVKSIVENQDTATFDFLVKSKIIYPDFDITIKSEDELEDIFEYF